MHTLRHPLPEEDELKDFSAAVVLISEVELGDVVARASSRRDQAVDMD